MQNKRNAHYVRQGGVDTLSTQGIAMQQFSLTFMYILKIYATLSAHCHYVRAVFE